MLLESGLSVTETCFSAGFGSLSGFLYTFRQTTGMSPSAYKDCIKQK
jgi:AraC-like DNA-binding protein